MIIKPTLCKKYMKRQSEALSTMTVVLTVSSAKTLKCLFREELVIIVTFNLRCLPSLKIETIRYVKSGVLSESNMRLLNWFDCMPAF